MYKIEDIINKIICGDCLEVMKNIPDNSVDTVLTDPPYNLSTIKRFKAKDSGEKWNVKSGVFHRSSKGFMGKEWDNEIAFQKETWEEILRVAKPGATLLCFGSPRTYHRLACAIEDAGWILKDCLMFLHGQGFPKATDISLQLDKKAGLQKQRGVGGFNTGGIQEQQNRKAKLYKGSVTDGSKLKGYDEPKSEEAKLWNGWKSHGLKPSYEPIVVAIKENEGSYAENALKWGVSGLNIDGGRIEHKPRLTGTRKNGKEIQAQPSSYKGSGTRSLQSSYDKKMFENNLGRFPANLILECLCDEVVEIEEKKEPYSYKGKSYQVEGFIKNNKPQAPSNYNDTKSGLIHTNPECPCYMLDRQSNNASRFFYCAKASREERNRGLENLPDKPAGFAMRDDKFTRENMGNTPAIKREPVKNNHPTVKPLKLMEYLCNLTKTPTGGIVLDPFVGSGTTGMACIKTKRPYVLIEKEKEYCDIAEARIKAQPSPLF